MGWQDAPIVNNATPAPEKQPAWKSAPLIPQDNLAYKVENQESKHNPNAVNAKSGAEGSMQTLPSTLRDPGFGVTPAKDESPEEMSRVGKDYLGALRKKYGNDTLALAAYNWGPGHVNQLVAEGITPEKDMNKFMSQLPKETQTYISKISSDTSIPAWQKAPLVAPAQKTSTSNAPQSSEATPPATSVTPQNGIMDKLASISDPARIAGANLVANMAAPFLSDKSIQILKDKGLYSPKESPLHEFNQAVYGTVTAPIQPIIDATTGAAQKAGEATIGKKATDTAGNILGTATDIAGFALPGVGKGAKPEVLDTPLKVEQKLVDLEKQHDSTTDPHKQAQIKQQMMDTIKQHPEAENEKMDAAKYGKTPAWQAAPIVQKSLPTQAAEGLRNVVAPEAAGAKAGETAGTIRAETGTANRNISKAEAKLEQSYNQAADMTPAQQNDYYQYVEGRSQGAKLADPHLQKMADETKAVLEDTCKDIEALPEGDKIGFYQDYFPHQFKQPEQGRAFANQFVSKQGSSGNLKARKYPTLADARAAGLELADPNPVRAASKYATSMQNYLASKRIATQIVDKGDAKYYTPGKQPEGWVPLVGRFAERTRSYMKEPNPGELQATASHEKLYAPQEVARIYNNFYGRGLEGTDLGKPYELGRKLTAANTAAELGFSAYHLGTITGQLLANDVSRIIKNAAVGDWTGVAKATKSATTGQIPFVKGSTYKLGGKLIKQYKGLEDHGIDMESIAEHFERGGGKIGQEKLYRPSEQGGLVTGKGGIKQSVRDIKDQWNQPGATPKAKAALNVFQRSMEDISYPLFEKYIPNIKTGAFANLMGDWVRQHPSATDAEIAAARKHYVDLVDDRFGEMNMDNVFWSKYLKQASSLFLRAQGWDIGLVRQAGGGVLDTAKILENAFKGKKIDSKLLDRPAFLASVIGTMALTAAAYQYMKTGKAPDEMLDYFAPKTGGISTRGTPERTVLPTAAHGREILHMAAPYASEGAFGTENPLSGVTQEISNKVASFPRNLGEAYNNEDYFGGKIGDTTGPAGWAGSVPARVGHVAEGFLPFGLTGQGDKMQGSNLSGVERRLLGMRPAGMEISDPQDFKEMRWAQEIKKEAKQEKANARREGEKE